MAKSTKATKATKSNWFLLFSQWIRGLVWNRSSGGSDYWIGLYKSAAAKTDNCYWLDDNPSTFRQWASGEPNSYSRCIRMASGGLFKDISCYQDYGYVCKVKEGIALWQHIIIQSFDYCLSDVGHIVLQWKALLSQEQRAMSFWCTGVGLHFSGEYSRCLIRFHALS